MPDFGEDPMIRPVTLGAAFASAAIMLSACGGTGSSDQVIVHLDENPNDLAAAQRVADAQCRQHGGRARLVLRIHNQGGPLDGSSPLVPDAVFACDPVP
jgi:hypothetical protein